MGVPPLARAVRLLAVSAARGNRAGLAGRGPGELPQLRGVRLKPPRSPRTEHQGQLVRVHIR